MIKCLKFLLISAAVLLAVASGSNAQQHSENGWALPPYDTLRVLVVFIEIDYDTLGHIEILTEGSDVWPVGQLPTYADSIFDPKYRKEPIGKLSAYYEESSLGNLIVLGDYYPELVVIPYSQMLRGQINVMFGLATDIMESGGSFRSASGFGLKDFDKWSNSKGRGTLIAPSGADFEGVDHIMVITRNYHKFPNSSGQASPSSAGTLGGKRSNSYSLFSGGRKFPFSILKHELNHLFLGGNNFHSGGGNSPGFSSYILPVQGGWSMMGGGNSSLLTCSAWDRYRLGWKLKDNVFLISARDSLYQEVNSDLNADNPTHQGTYFLRDFIRTGDALRIRLPFIPDSEFQQWLWIENHTTQSRNGSQFDKFMYEDHDCTSHAVPGLYMTRQVDAEVKEGKDVYNSVLADYLRPLPANGSFDMVWSTEKFSPGFCVNGKAYNAYELTPELENPLSGNHEQEQPLADLNDVNGKIERDEVFATMLKRTPDGFSRLDFMGNAEHAFRLGGNSILGIGTNPTGASMTTYVNSRGARKNPDKRNNNAIYLNGIRIEILQAFADGTLKIKVRFDDNELVDSRRWCGSEIVLNNHNPNGTDLRVTGKLTLDRSYTVARFNEPDTVNGRVAFSDPTKLRLNSGAQMVLEGRLIVLADSELRAQDGAFLEIKKGAQLKLKDKSALYVEEGARISIHGRIKIRKDCLVYAENEDALIKIRKATRQKKRVILADRKAHEKGAP